MKTILALLTTFTALSSFAVMPTSIKNEAQRTRLKCENLSIAEYSGLEITEGIQGYMRVFKVYLSKKENGKRVLVSSGYLEPEKELLTKPFFTGNIAVPNSNIKFNLANYYMLEGGKASAYAKPEADRYDLIRVGTQLTDEEKIQYPDSNDSYNKSFFYDVDCREFN
jgi:hypothetical protein